MPNPADPAEQRRILRRTLERALRQHTAARPGASVALAEAAWRIIGPALEQRDEQLAQLRAAATCDASMPGLDGQPVGPCVLRHGHDGPVHQAANGATWWPTDVGPIPGVRPAAEILADTDIASGTVPEAFRAAWRRHEMRGDKVPIRLIGEDDHTLSPDSINTDAIHPEPPDGHTIWVELLRLYGGPLPNDPPPLCPCGAQRFASRIIHNTGCWWAQSREPLRDLADRALNAAPDQHPYPPGIEHATINPKTGGTT